MPPTCPLVVFTDLDGTLIDHHTYDWAPARPAVAALQRCNVPLILASSKTAAEISALRHELNATQWPSIVENGAGILPAGAHDLPGGGENETVREALAALPRDLRKHFTGFGDLTPAALADLTGLSIDAAKLAQTRRFSEPGQWRGSEDQKAAFLAELAESGIKAQQGGRFLTLSFGKNKVDQMHHIIQKYAPNHTVALGDAPNDVAMLEAADFGIVIANPNRDPLPPLNGEGSGRVIRTTLPGPQGWNRAILAHLDHLKIQ